MYKICIADDERYVRKSVEERILLSGCGVELAGSAQDGMQALELYRRVHPDIFLVDINMPLLDGLALIARIKKEDASCATKFVIISGYDEFDYLQKSIRLGVMNYIKKPIVQEELNEVLRGVCEVLDVQRREKEKIEHRKRTMVYDDLLKQQKECTVTPSTLLLLYSATLVELAGSLELEKLQKQVEIEEECTVTCVVFHGADNTVLLLMNKELPAARRAEWCGFLARTVNGAAVHTEWNVQELAKTVIQMEKALSLRFYDSNRRIFEIVQQEETVDNLERLEIALSYGQSDQCSTEIEEILDCVFENRENLLNLNQIYRRLIVLILNRYLKFNLYIPDEIKEELLLFSLSKYRFRTQITEYLCLQAEQLIRRVRDQEQSSELVEQVCRFLEEHYAEELSLNALSEEFFVTPTYLSHRFREKKRVTITQYVEDLRLSKAKHFLDVSELSISEIAAKVGYCDSNYFTRVFRKTFGFSPSTYRKGTEPI